MMTEDVAGGHGQEIVLGLHRHLEAEEIVVKVIVENDLEVEEAVLVVDHRVVIGHLIKKAPYLRRQYNNKLLRRHHHHLTCLLCKCTMMAIIIILHKICRLACRHNNIQTMIILFKYRLKQHSLRTHHRL